MPELINIRGACATWPDPPEDPSAAIIKCPAKMGFSHVVKRDFERPSLTQKLAICNIIVTDALSKTLKYSKVMSYDKLRYYKHGNWNFYGTISNTTDLNKGVNHDT
jgi:hypothetical protein